MIAPNIFEISETSFSEFVLTPISRRDFQFKRRKAVFKEFNPEAAAKIENRKQKREIETVFKKGRLTDLKKKIKLKILSHTIVSNLISENPNSDLMESYKNTLNFCQSEYLQEGKVIKSKYCNNRFCYSCNRIRTGKMINNYLPLIELMQENMQMLTLTIPNVQGYQLRDSIKEMILNFQKIKDLARKSKADLVGLRKLEVTFNQNRNDFHPHFHILLESKDQAEFILKHWLRLYSEADILGQDIQTADLNSVKELFKYFTKYWSTGSKKKAEKINYKSLDQIFFSMYGLRVFQPFGMKKYKLQLNESEEIEQLEKTEYNIKPYESKSWYYEELFSNFIDTETGEELQQIKPTKKEIKLYKERILLDTSSPPLFLTNCLIE